jgi:hypothetical protein
MGDSNDDHVSKCAVADLVFVAAAVIAIIHTKMEAIWVKWQRAFFVPCIDADFMESLTGKVELGGKLDKDV